MCVCVCVPRYKLLGPSFFSTDLKASTTPLYRNERETPADAAHKHIYIYT